MAAATTPPTRIRAVAILPARIASRRLARKMLLAESGRALFEHTAVNVAACDAIERVVVATDSDEIAAHAAERGIEAVLTSPAHPSGTDRVHEALTRLGQAYDVVLNVQGDEPELDPRDLARLVGAFADAEVELATLAGPLHSEEEADAPQVVKVVLDARGDALYFSRSQLPHRPSDVGARRGEPLASYARDGAPGWLGLVRRHIGVYAYRPAALAEFCALPEGPLEQVENLEQLRWLEAGRNIRVLDTGHVPLGIDTRADYDAFVQRMRARAESSASSSG
jgi:3-deoxy-manno-octulosonate cytidylyltransferase (CMP-KDO synthetase)